MIAYKNYNFYNHTKNECLEVTFKYESELANPYKKSQSDEFVVRNLRHETTEAEYIRKVEKIKDFIVKGDVYEVNLTQQLEGEFQGPPFKLFKKLYSKNDAPFSCYMNLDKFHILSSSPELFLSADKYKIETRPIKGTAKRNSDVRLDEISKNILLNSEKDKAELFMIIDLLRNDLGKVSEIGSVKVLESMKLEKFKNVYHLVGIIESVLSNNKDYVDLIKACFPGGSITGCPKIRAMEIIDELEKYSRNLYTGTIFLMNKQFLISNIIIRTAIIINNQIFINSGGAVTIDSDPKSEYEEMLIKIKNIIESLE